VRKGIPRKLFFGIMIMLSLAVSVPLYGLGTHEHDAVETAERELEQHISQCQLEEELALAVPSSGNIEKTTHVHSRMDTLHGNCTVTHSPKINTSLFHVTGFTPGSHPSKIGYLLFYRVLPVICFERFYYRQRETYPGSHCIPENHVNRNSAFCHIHACSRTCSPIRSYIPGDIS